MPTRAENISMIQAASQESSRTSHKAQFPKVNLDLDVFGAKEIRDVLKSRAHCLRAGFSAQHIIISTLNEIRNHYILKVGLPTYLSQMLGEVAKAPIRHCLLYYSNDQPIKLDQNYDPEQPLQRYIAQRFQWDELPSRIEVYKEGDPERIEVRYL
ncbi:MAG: hypothetical protein KJ077_09640 [Anaerolineae bacterium]|nr:hypothetical protein [Anaerolineae bacterium]